MTVLPDVANGAVVVRTIGRVCTNQDEAPNAYCPPNTFISTCQITALAEDCTARIAPSQINSIVSELLCLAVALDPNGPWDCNSNCNLGTMFNTWADQFAAGTVVHTDGVTILGDGSDDEPIRLSPNGAVASICSDDSARTALAACLVSAEDNNLLSQAEDGGLYIAGSIVTVSPITGTGSVADPVGLDIPALISGDGRNLIHLGDDGKLHADLHVTGAGVSGSGTESDPLVINIDGDILVTSVCSDADVRADLINCIVSTDPFNRVTLGTDGGLYVIYSGATGDSETITEMGPFSIIPVGVVNRICDNEDAPSLLSACLISEESGNQLTQAVDGKLFVPAAPTSITDGTEILFEIAFSRVNEFVDEDILSGYVTAMGFTLPGAFTNSRAFVRNPSGDLTIYVVKNNIIIAQILYSIGTGSWTWILAADVPFVVGDVLEFRAGSNATFDLLSVTLLVRRPITVA